MGNVPTEAAAKPPDTRQGTLMLGLGLMANQQSTLRHIGDFMISRIFCSLERRQNLIHRGHKESLEAAKSRNIHFPSVSLCSCPQNKGKFGHETFSDSCLRVLDRYGLLNV